ncbi:cobalt-precorrin-6A reductase [Rhodococcus sp. NPDC003318]|uniref:cobalt-precorrin-6A reductase n=1 Tax=Rhodococcus sp. NPDC003318 TaxID=3364503 RepID=UPI0036A95B07
MRLLVLGGTSEARALAGVLVDEPGIECVSSLAGRVREPRLPAGEVRVGGFGGVDGLATWLRDNGVDAVVDATHPFAARITANAAAATARVGTPLLVLRRPAWVPVAGDRWHPVPDLATAARTVPTLGERILLTIGRQGVDAFADAPGRYLIRAIDPPEGALPAETELLLDRGPFTVESEIALLRDHRIEVVVTKNSGGPLTEAKLVAARESGIPVVVVERPALPAGVPVVGAVTEASAWVHRVGAAQQ